MWKCFTFVLLDKWEANFLILVIRVKNLLRTKKKIWIQKLEVCFVWSIFNMRTNCGLLTWAELSLCKASLYKEQTVITEVTSAEWKTTMPLIWCKTKYKWHSSSFSARTCHCNDVINIHSSCLQLLLKCQLDKSVKQPPLSFSAISFCCWTTDEKRRVICGK